MDGNVMFDSPHGRVRVQDYSSQLHIKKGQAGIWVLTLDKEREDVDLRVQFGTGMRFVLHTAAFYCDEAGFRIYHDGKRMPPKARQWLIDFMMLRYDAEWKEEL